MLNKPGILREKEKNPYLFNDNLACIELQKNIKYTENLIKESIDETNVRVQHYGSTQVAFWKSAA